MTLLLREKSANDQLLKRDRTVLILPYCRNSYIAFFKDYTYEHIQRNPQTVLHSGTLPFLAEAYLPVMKEGRAAVLGSTAEGSYLCGILDVDEEYEWSLRQVSPVAPQKTTHFHLQEGEDDKPFLIMVQSNIENGLAFAVMDIKSGLWCEQMLALNSRFLRYTFISHPGTQTFAFVAPGERFDSIHYSSAMFEQETNADEIKIRLTFIITREIKLRQHFVVIGGFKYDPTTLYLIGNARVELQNQASYQSFASVILNTQLIENEQPQETRVQICSFGQHKPLLYLRKQLTVIENSLLVLLKADRKCAIARVSVDREEILIELESSLASQLKLSVKRDCLASERNHCEQFFEKIKQSPSLLQWEIVEVRSKREVRLALLKSTFPRLPIGIAAEVLRLL